MKNNKLKIVSGGQTGVDRGALLAAMDLGLEWGVPDDLRKKTLDRLDNFQREKSFFRGSTCIE